MGVGVVGPERASGAYGLQAALHAELQALRGARLRVRSRVVQLGRVGLRRVGALVRLDYGGGDDIRLAACTRVTVGGFGKRHPQERLPQQRCAMACGMDERESL